MYFKDALARLAVRHPHHDLPVEASGTHQRGVEYIGSVRRGKDDYIHSRIEAVHFSEQLIQSLLALIASRANAGAAASVHCVLLVDHDYGWRRLLRLPEEIVH